MTRFSKFILSLDSIFNNFSWSVFVFVFLFFALIFPNLFVKFLNGGNSFFYLKVYNLMLKATNVSFDCSIPWTLPTSLICLFHSFKDFFTCFSPSAV